MDDAAIWAPSPRVALLAAAALAAVAAAASCVWDCDEAYNYWEPLHYLLYGSGLQTWEYSPRFALRSWAYLMPSYAVGRGLQAALAVGSEGADKVLVSKALRGSRASHRGQDSL